MDSQNVALDPSLNIVQALSPDAAKDEAPRQVAADHDTSRQTSSDYEIERNVEISPDMSRHDEELRDTGVAAEHDKIEVTETKRGQQAEDEGQAAIGEAERNINQDHTSHIVENSEENSLELPNLELKIKEEPTPSQTEERLDKTQARPQSSETTIPELPENWLDIEQAAALLRELGISRTGRTIQRLCKKGDLEAKLVPTENASRYIINEKSIKAFAKRHNEMLPGPNFGSDEEDAFETTLSHSLANRSNNTLGNQGSKTSPHAYSAQLSGAGISSSSANAAVQSEHMQQIVELKDQHIAMLQSQLTTANTQIAVKDEQINTMLERDHETNVLIQNLQRLVALPEGRNQSEDWNRSI